MVSHGRLRPTITSAILLRVGGIFFLVVGVRVLCYCGGWRGVLLGLLETPFVGGIFSLCAAVCRILSPSRVRCSRLSPESRVMPVPPTIVRQHFHQIRHHAWHRQPFLL